MTSSSDRQDQNSTLNGLQALRSLPLPEGMQDRITERIRQRQLQLPPRALRHYTWELWLGVSIATVTVAAIFCVVALQAHRAARPLIAANVPQHTVAPTPASTNAQPAANSPRKAAHAYRVKQAGSAAPIPHTPPPQPLTAQERLLLTLANTPSLAASVAQTQTISEHGLGPNALFELDHEQLQPMLSDSRLSQPLPQNLP